MVICSSESQRIWICSFCFVMAAVCPMTRVASANVDEVTHEIHFIIISYIFWKVARRFAEGYYLYNQIHRFVIPWYCLGLKFPAPLWQLAATLKVPRPKTVGTKTAVVNQSNSFGLLFFCWQVRIPCSLLWIQRQRERRCKTASASVPSLSTFIDLDFRQEGANGRSIRLWGHPTWHMTYFILVFFPACIP